MSLMKIYERMPSHIQNIAVSLYGYKREQRRYGGAFKGKLQLFLKHEMADERYISNYQKEELLELFNWADKSDHYHSLFAELGIDLEQNPMKTLETIPILSKQELRDNENSFHTLRKKGDQLFHTSGSTGTPLNVIMNIDDFRTRMAILERMKLRFGVNHNTRHISFVGKKITSRNSKTFWRINKPGHQMVMSVYDLSDDNADAYIKTITAYNPEMIEGYPSAITVVAKWFINNKQSLKLKCVLVTAETLSDEQKYVIESAFNCPVVNYYGSTEGAPMITPCEYGSLHVEYESGIIEFLDEKDNIASEGTLGRMIVTSFLSKSMPLIRYDIGDMAIVGNNKCKCGRCTQTVQAIIGRCDDVFKTTEKGYVGRLSTSLKLLPSHVRRAQIQQISIDEFVLLLESDTELSSYDEKVIREDLYDKLGKVDIEFKYTDRIPIGPNGKFRSQVSMIGQ